MDVDFAHQGIGWHFFYFFLGKESPESVAKVPAAGDSRLVF